MVFLVFGHKPSIVEEELKALVKTKHLLDGVPGHKGPEKKTEERLKVG